MADLLDVAYSHWVDGFGPFGDSQETRAKIDEALRATWVDRETWGMDADVLDAIPQAAERADQDGGR